VTDSSGNPVDLKALGSSELAAVAEDEE
jgi:hypothetical protein